MARRRLESVSEGMERVRESPGRRLATSYVRLVLERKGIQRYKVANDLHKYLSTEFRDESSEFQQEFINYFDSKEDSFTSNTLYDLVNCKEDRNERSSDPREAAILLIVVLAETMISLEGGKRVFKFAHYLLKALVKMDDSCMELAALALSFLIQTAKANAAELVEKCLDECFEWTLYENSENARMASSLLLRQLALFTSTAFFMRAQAYFATIFRVMRSPKVKVRLAAAASLREALSVISQREAREKKSWYYSCYKEALGSVVDKGDGMHREERWHCMLLTLNELTTLSCSSIEKERIRAQLALKGTRKDFTFAGPLEFLLTAPLRSVEAIVESRTAATIVQQNFSTIWERIMEVSRASKQSYLIETLIQVLPRLSPWMVSAQFATCIEILIPLMTKYPESHFSLGLLLSSNSENTRKYIPTILSNIKEILSSIKKKRNDLPEHSSVFILLTLIVRSFGRNLNRELTETLPLLFNYPLCKGLKAVLYEIHSQNDHWKDEVINGLLHQISIIIMGESIIGKTISSSFKSPPIKIDSSQYSLERYDMAMESLGEFQFNPAHLRIFIEYIAEFYLVCDSVPLRVSAVKCCIAMLKPFILQYDTACKSESGSTLTFVVSILKCIVGSSVVDSDVFVRLCAIEELSKGDSSLLSILSQPDLLEFLRLSLRDDNLPMREATVSLVSKIGMLNPSLVFPRLRRVLLETLGELTNCRDEKMEGHAARLISKMASECPKFMRPYLGSVMQALIPKLRKEYRYAETTIHILNTLSELALVGGSEIVESISVLFPLLIAFIADNSTPTRREGALTALCSLSSSTTFAVDVYREYPHLMTILISLMATEVSQSMRRLTMRVLGTLGAIHPYSYKEYSTRAITELGGSNCEMSLPFSARFIDSRLDIIELFNYGKCTTSEFYLSITIANLMKMLEDDTNHNSYEEIMQDLIIILGGMGSDSPSFVSKVVPQLILITKNSKKEYKEFFLTKLGSLLSILDREALCHMEEVFSLLAIVCKEDSSNQQAIIRVIHTISSTLHSDMGPYVSEVIPYLLDGMKRERQADHKLVSMCLACVRALGGCLPYHLHLLIPPLLLLIGDSAIEMSIRKEALDSLSMISEKEDLSEYSPSIFQTWNKIVGTKDLQGSAMGLLRLIIASKWRHLNVYHRSIESSLKSNSIECPEYNEYLREKGGDWLRWGGDSLTWKEDGNDGGEADSLQNRRKPSSLGVKSSLFLPVSSTHKINFDMIRRSMGVTLVSSKEDWSEWLAKVRQTCIRFSPSLSIRTVSSLAELHLPLGVELFNAAFVSIWCEMSDELQDEVTQNLIGALGSGQTEVVLSVLNLCEFIEHSNTGPLLISFQELGKAAERVKCYAKALRYKELEVKIERKGEISLRDAQKLIHFSNKLNLQEGAVGVIKLVEKQKGEISKMTRSGWYEKLNEWEKSLQLLNECREERDKEGESIHELNEHEWKCLEALGKWAELSKKMDSFTSNGDKMGVVAARAAWMIDDWNRMEEWTGRVNENTLEGSYLRAVVALKGQHYSKAHSYIQKCRDIHDVQLSGIARESYERAYPAIVVLQELTELEEAIEYRLRPERRARIALLWSRRLRDCRENVDQWNRLLMIRSIVLAPSEMQSLRVKFASLCRSQSKMSQARSQLSQLLGVSSSTPLESVTPSHDKPHLVLALSKQLWMDNHKVTAISLLDSLARNLDRWPQSAHSQDKREIMAKIFLKLGEWTETQSSVLPYGRMGDKESLLVSIRVSLETQSEVGNWKQEENETAKVLHFYSKATEYDPEWHKGWHRLAIAYFNVLSRNKGLRKGKEVEKASFEYAIEAVRAFTKALQLASGSRLEDSLRLLSLWFQYGENEEVYEVLRHSNKSLPLVMWLEVIPQIMGRLDSTSKSGVLMQEVVVEVAKKYPQSLVFALTVGEKSSNEARASHSAHVLQLLSRLYPTLVREAKEVSHELVRCSILWHELWFEALEEASRVYFQEKDINGMLEILEPMHKMVDEGPSTLKEHSFYQTYLCDLEDARKFCHAYERTRNTKELTQAWELYYGIFKRIGVQLKTITSLDLNYISPILQKARELELAVPGTFEPSLPPVTIYSFLSHLQVISSKQRPRKMSMRGSDGKKYSFLLKGHEDPRQDERVMQFFGLINTLLLHNGDTSRRNVTIQRYSITALSPKSGLIGWIPYCDTLHSLIKEYREKKKINLLMEHKVITSNGAQHDRLTLAQKIQLFQMALLTSNGEDLADIIWLKSSSAEIWFERRTNYTRSMGCMSMVGHILGLGDRHPSNVMIDRESGKIVHIDFGDCFEVAQTREKFPEKIPFRLTRMLIQAMEMTGIEGNYRLTCERVLQVLRGKKDSLLAVLEAFVYDPLINWRLLDVNKRNPGEKKDTSKVDSSYVNEEVSRKVLDRIKLKLSGREFNVHEVTSIEDQVDKLVAQATSHSNLAQSYIGWCPFW